MCPCCIEKLSRAFAVAFKHKPAKPATRARRSRPRARPVAAWPERLAAR